MKKTKIVCTLGPSSCTKEVISAMYDAGMNVCRLNFSHGTHEEHAAKIKIIKELREERGIPLPILLDTKGPEFRTGRYENGKITLSAGDEFTFTTENILGNEKKVSVNYPYLCEVLKKGDTILLNNGLMEFEVLSVSDKEVKTVVKIGGETRDHKSMFFPNKDLKLDFLSEQDKSDLLFGIEQGIDFIALSFVSEKANIDEVREFLNANGGEGIDLIAKIENSSGVKNLESIVKASDGVMVARGDLGVELPYETIPNVQKRMIDVCRILGKRCITATEMLESMIHSPRPTRAEISDVANAVFDGSSAVMLSGETAAGKYPVDAVKTMARIAEQAEQDAFAADIYKNIWHAMDHSDNTNAVSAAACTMAEQTYAQAIIADTSTGKAARRVAKYRPAQMILAATPSEKVYHQLALVWGVYPLRTQPVDSVDVLFHCAIEKAKELGYLHSGDTVVMTAGIPLNTHGSTNMVKVQTIR